jgi:uncharacterized membrane protein
VTVAAGVNNLGQVVGGYLDAQGRPPGYRWDKGRFTTIDVPGAIGTMLGDLNDRGEIVGVYGDDPDDPIRGYRGAPLSAEPWGLHDVRRTRRPVHPTLQDQQRGQIVSAYENPDAETDGQPSPMRMPMMMSGV